MSTAFLIHQASFRAGKFIGRYYEYNSVFVFTGAFSVFALFKMIEPRLRIVECPIRILAKYSLPIYGVHALLLDFITQKGFMHFKHPVLDISLTFITTLALSLLVAVVIKKFDKYN
ncbi:MAG: hypothetical protein JW963_00360 [Anaerolineales bacterium]|nr:hypothetical protein [Anaerolineales bacterium]